MNTVISEDELFRPFFSDEFHLHIGMWSTYVYLFRRIKTSAAVQQFRETWMIDDIEMNLLYPKLVNLCNNAKLNDWDNQKAIAGVAIALWGYRWTDDVVCDFFFDLAQLDNRMMQALVKWLNGPAGQDTSDWRKEGF